MHEINNIINLIFINIINNETKINSTKYMGFNYFSITRRVLINKIYKSPKKKLSFLKKLPTLIPIIN